jgi:hypothetical protein
MKQTLRRTLLTLAAVSCALLACPPSAEAGVGGKLEAAKQADFFKFFGLVEDGPRANEGRLTVVNFRPRVEKFRRLVSLTVKVAGDDSIREMSLALERSFVDDRADGIFARDIAKSFLREAVPAADAARVDDLANEIEFPKETPGYTVMRTRPDPKLPATPTPGYEVYTGARELYEAAFDASALRMENARGGAGARLRMTVAAKAATPARKGAA